MQRTKNCDPHAQIIPIVNSQIPCASEWGIIRLTDSQVIVGISAQQSPPLLALERTV